MELDLSTDPIAYQRGDGQGTRRVLVDTSRSGQTLVSPVISSPTITNPTVSGQTPVTITTTPITLGATHVGRTTVLNKADGCAFTLPAATGSGDRYTIRGLVTLTADTTIKVANSSDYMIGTAILFQDGGDTVVGFATANTGTVATESDTVDLFDTGNVTGGIKGFHIELVDIAANVWQVHYVSDAAGTEATPFKVTV